MDLHVSQQVQLELEKKAPCSCLDSLRNQQTLALSQGVLQPDVTNIETKGLSEIVVSSSWRAIEEESKPPGDIHGNNSSQSSGSREAGSGAASLSHQARRRHWRRQACLSTSISQEWQKSRADTVICLWHRIRPSQSDH